MPTKTARSVPLKVTITPELHERLREVAAQLGQAPATIASMAIGQYVAQMSRTLGAAQTMVDTISKQVAPELERQLNLLSTIPGLTAGAPVVIDAPPPPKKLTAPRKGRK